MPHDGEHEALAAQALARAVNMMGFEPQRFAEQLCWKEHRTLQQNAMRVIWAVIKQWNEDFLANRYDARNEQTCRFANALVKAVESGDVTINPYFPTI